MTPDALRAAISALGWTAGQLATQLGCHRNLPLAWLSGRAAIPPPVASWLAGLARAHQKMPAPVGWRVR